MREVSATNSRGSGFGLCAKKNMSQKYACVFNAKQSEKYCFCALIKATVGEYLDIHMWGIFGYSHAGWRTCGKEILGIYIQQC